MQTTPRIGVQCEKGRRPVNQDGALAALLPDGRRLVAIADGMGGHAAGEVASRRALEALRDALSTGAALDEAFTAANDAVNREADEDAALDGMGTTAVAVLLEEDRFHIANVGDSRAYLFSDGRIEQITLDHTYASESVRKGAMTPQEAAQSPWGRALTRSIGSDRTIDVDIFGPFPALPGSTVMLCTDGIYAFLPDERMLGIVEQADDPRSASRELVAGALVAGSDDNVTAVVIEFVEAGTVAGATAPSEDFAVGSLVRETEAAPATTIADLTVGSTEDGDGTERLHPLTTAGMQNDPSEADFEPDADAGRTDWSAGGTSSSGDGGVGTGADSPGWPAVDRGSAHGSAAASGPDAFTDPQSAPRHSYEDPRAVSPSSAGRVLGPRSFWPGENVLFVLLVVLVLIWFVWLLINA